MYTPPVSAPYDTLVRILLHLQVPAHRIGYTQLCEAIPRFAQDTTQSITKDVYPYVAAQLGYPDWRAVESAIRDVIADTWENGNRDAWESYFPGYTSAPSNKRFIATLAEYLK